MGIQVSTFHRIETGRKDYNWYIYFLTDDLNTKMSEEFIGFFKIFATIIGDENLAIRGAEGSQRSFYNSLIESQFYQELVKSTPEGLKSYDTLELPALLVCNHHPNEINEAASVKVDKKKLIFLILRRSTLQEMYRENELQSFLTLLGEAIKKDDEGFISKENFRIKWGWMLEYIKFKIPFICGELDVTNILKDLAKRHLQ